MASNTILDLIVLMFAILCLLINIAIFYHNR